MILEACKAPLQQLCLHESAVMVQTQASEMLQNKLKPEKLFKSIGHTSKSEIPRFKKPEAHHQMSDLTYKCPT